MDLAWMYFVTFDLVSGESVAEQRLEWDRRFFKCMSQQELGKFCTVCTVCMVGRVV